MRPIDADEMLTRLEKWNTSDLTDKALYNFTLHRILEQPTIEPEQPEIVRCRDCRWSPWRSRMYADSAVEIKVCSHSRSPEGFCAWGKEAKKCGD